jgi:hypothetical protein
MNGFIKDKYLLAFFDGSQILGLYNSEDELIEHLRTSFGEPGLTVEQLLKDGTYTIQEVPHYKSIEDIRDEKINKILK